MKSTVGPFRLVLPLLLAASVSGVARGDVLAWVPTPLGETTVGTGTVAIEPGSSGRIWAQVGGRYGGPLRVSADGGRTFGPPPVAIPSSKVLDFAFHPLDPRIVYAATKQGLYRINGAHFELFPWGIELGSSEPAWIEAHPRNPDIFLLGLTSGGGVFRCVDGGRSWTSTGMAGGGSSLISTGRALFEPSGSGPVLIRYRSNQWGENRLWSGDHGATWEGIEPSFWSDELYFAADPMLPDVVYASRGKKTPGGETHLVSRDFGLTWSALAPPNEEAIGPLVCLPSGTILSVGKGGIYRTDWQGRPWVRTTTLGLPLGRPSALLALDAAGEQLLLVTSAGLFRTESVAEAPARTMVLPSIVDAFGRNGARYTTSLTLFNASEGMAEGTVEYVASSAAGSTGSGSFPIRLRAWEQVVVADASKWLRDAGLAVPEATPEQPQVGTLTLRTSDGLWAGEVVATSRVTTPSGPGNAATGLWSLRAGELHRSPAWLPGLRETAAERTNVAVVNGGSTGRITVRATFRGDDRSFTRDAVLGPGEWAQWNSPLAAGGVERADAVVERIAGEEPFAAYATIVDTATNDGSFLPARPMPAAGPLVLPVAVEAKGFETEVVLFNASSRDAAASLSFVDSLAPAPGGLAPLAPFEVIVPAGRSVTIPRLLEAMREAGLPIGPRTLSHAGFVRVEATVEGEPTALLASARTTIPAPDGGTYGVSYPALTGEELARDEAWLSGLGPSASVRSNVAFLNPGTEAVWLQWAASAYNDYTSGFSTGWSESFCLQPGEWKQFPLPTGQLPHGLVVRVRRVSGTGPFAAYGIVNDGPLPGLGTGDGSYVPMSRVR